METVLNTGALIFAGLCVLGALYFFLRSLRSRFVPELAYGVARQEARHAMLLSFFGGLLFLIIGLLLFALYGLIGFDFLIEASPGDDPTPTITPGTEPTPAISTTDPAPAAATPTGPTNTPIALQNLSTATNTPAPPTETPTPSITPTPAPTDTPDVDTAVVNSPNGLWLREAPGGTQEVELIPDGTILILLPGLETANDIEWQQVRTPAGNEGWVAVDFIIYQQ